MKKKNIIIIVAAVVLILAGVGYRQYEKFSIRTKIGDYKQCIKMARNFFDQKDEIIAQCEKEKVIVEKPDDYADYLNIPMFWKNIAEKTKAEIFLRRAIAIYLLAYDRFPAKYTVSWNLAQLYNQMNDLQNAEKYFLAAIENNNIDSEPYLAAAEFYRYKLKKDKDFMIDFYEKAAKEVMLNPAVIIDDYARYLADIGEYGLALAEYEKLAAKQPDGFKAVIDELKMKISESKIEN